MAENEPENGDVLTYLEELEDDIEAPEQRRTIRKAIAAARRTTTAPPRLFGNVIRNGFGRGDVGEALVGSVVFGIPMLVEDGTLTVGTYLAGTPLFSLLTLCFGIAMAIGILYVAEFQQVEVVNPIFGIIPRRLVGVVGTAFITAVFLMALWGRADWTQPWIAYNQTLVAFVPMVIGAALGDILPAT